MWSASPTTAPTTAPLGGPACGRMGGRRRRRGRRRTTREDVGMADRPRVVVVGGGFAGFHAARSLSRRMRDDDVEIGLITSTDYFLYLPLLPEVAAGLLEPRRIAVPLAASLPGVRLLLGEV